jgi:hypothetical protein
MEVLNIPNAALEILKGDLGLTGKDVSALTLNDKVRLKIVKNCLGDVHSFPNLATYNNSASSLSFKHAQARRIHGTGSIKPYARKLTANAKHAKPQQEEQ